MAGSSSAEQFPDWEWAFIPDITNEAEMEEEVADPCKLDLPGKAYALSAREHFHDYPAQPVG